MPSPTAQLPTLARNKRAWFAIREAMLVDDVSTIFGHSLGDDVMLAALGVVVHGPEVLRIGPASDGHIMIEQFWFEGLAPGQSEGLLWDDDGRYRGRVMAGQLYDDRRPG